MPKSKFSSPPRTTVITATVITATVTVPDTVGVIHFYCCYGYYYYYHCCCCCCCCCCRVLLSERLWRGFHEHRKQHLKYFLKICLCTSTLACYVLQILLYTIMYDVQNIDELKSKFYFESAWKLQTKKGLLKVCESWHYHFKAFSSTQTSSWSQSYKRNLVLERII